MKFKHDRNPLFFDGEYDYEVYIHLDNVFVVTSFDESYETNDGEYEDYYGSRIYNVTKRWETSVSHYISSSEELEASLKYINVKTDTIAMSNDNKIDDFIAWALDEAYYDGVPVIEMGCSSLSTFLDTHWKLKDGSWTDNRKDYDAEIEMLRMQAELQKQKKEEYEKRLSEAVISYHEYQYPWHRPGERLDKPTSSYIIKTWNDKETGEIIKTERYERAKV